jgi:hypothetical protein
LIFWEIAEEDEDEEEEDREKGGNVKKNKL